MPPVKNQDVRELVMQGLLSGMSVPQIAADLGMGDKSAYYYVKCLIEEGLIRKVGYGRYAAADKVEAAPPAPAANGKLAHSIAPRVEIPAFMKGRKPIRVYVERSPDEIDGVISLELKMNGQWFPLPTTADLRVCVGSDIPRWSAYQTTYHGVQAFRVTHANGSRPEYPHDPNVPVTVDTK